MKISIVIPAYNEERYIKKCISSIEKYRIDNLCEVIVVDNGSTDATPLLVRQFPFVTVVSEPRKGSNYARQKGLACANADLIAFLDADTAITRDWLQKAVNEFKKNKNLVALSGPVIYDLNQWYSFFIDAYFTVFYIPISKITGSLILGGNFVARKDAILGIGGFDTKIAFHGDDTNTARRLKKVGKVVFKRNFFIYTSARRLKKEGIAKTGFIYALNFFSEKIFHVQVTKKYSDIR